MMPTLRHDEAKMKAKLTEGIEEVDEDSDDQIETERSRLGIGAPPEGKALTNIKAEIKTYIDETVSVPVPKNVHDPSISLPKFDLTE